MLAGLDEGHEFTMVVDYDDLLRDDVVAAVRTHAGHDAVAMAVQLEFTPPRNVRALMMDDRGVGASGTGIALRTAPLLDGRALPAGKDLASRHLGSHHYSLHNMREAGLCAVMLRDEPRVLYRVGGAHSTSRSQGVWQTEWRRLLHAQVRTAARTVLDTRQLSTAEH